MSIPREQKLQVTIALPLGVGGPGGINSIMSEVGEAISVADPSVSLHFLTTRGAGHISFSAYWMARALVALSYRTVRGRIDVLHVNLSMRGSTYRKILLCTFARICGVPYVIHLHSGHYRDWFGKLGPAAQWSILRMLRGASCIIVLGSVWRDFLLEKDPTLSSRIVILHNATHRPKKSRVPSQDGCVRLLFLGKLREEKGILHLVAALGRLSTLPNWRATLAGDEKVAEVRRAISELGLSDRVHVPGHWMGPAEVEDLLAHADVLILPSLYEGLPMSVIEGMAAGLAVVATPVGAVEDIIEDEKSGLIVPPGDVPALANALQRLIEDPGLLKRLGDKARRFHETNLDITSYTARLSLIWRHVRSSTNQLAADGKLVGPAGTS